MSWLWNRLARLPARCLLCVSMGWLLPACQPRQPTNAALLSAPSPLLKQVVGYEPEKYWGKVPVRYYTDRGHYDYWRFPLVYPYAISCIDTNTYGTVCSEEGTTDYDASGYVNTLTDYFDRFTFDQHYFVGAKCRTPFDRDQPPYVGQYFIFSFADGKSQPVMGRPQLAARLQALRFTGDTTLQTIEDYFLKLDTAGVKSPLLPPPGRQPRH